MNRPLIIRYVASTIFAFACACSSSSAERVGHASAEIRDGKLDTTHEGVVFVDQRSGLICSGYVLTPDLVLTARHCASDISKLGTPSATNCEQEDLPLLDTSDVRVIVAVNITTAATPIRVVESIPVPTALGCENDVVLLRLEKPLRSKTGSGWLKTIEPRLDLPAMVGETFTAVGFGLDGEKPQSAGHRMQATGLHVVHVGEEMEPSGGFSREGDWVADRGPCGGDSGGPALDITGRSFGVMVRGQQTVCEYMKYNGITQLATFIREQTARSVNELHAQGYEDVPTPAWLTPPTDGSAKLGDDCWGASQCEAALACRPVGDRLRCTVGSCEACPDGTTCAEADDGLRTCVAVEKPSSASSGAEVDAATGGSRATADSRPVANAGCSLAHRDAGTASGIAMLLVGLGATARRRRRAGHATSRALAARPRGAQGGAGRAPRRRRDG